MWTGAATYYMTDHTDSSGLVLTPQFPGPAAAPESASQCGCLQSGHCEGTGSNYTADPVWTALAFSISDPHVFMPLYVASGSAATAVFTADAVSDLDCDAVLGTWRRIGASNGTDVTGNTTPFVMNEGE
jgi:hypothetical protein